MTWKDLPVLPRTIVFWCDTGSSRAVLVQRVVKDRDVEATEPEVQAEVTRLVKAKVLREQPNPYDRTDTFLTVNEFMAQSMVQPHRCGGLDYGNGPV